MRRDIATARNRSEVCPERVKIAARMAGSSNQEWLFIFYVAGLCGCAASTRPLGYWNACKDGRALLRL